MKSEPLNPQPAGQLGETGWAPPRWLSIFVEKGNGVLPGLLIFLITGLVFLPSLHNDFVHWDDNHTFYENEQIQGLDAARLRWMFTDVSYSMRYKPLSWLAYALIYKLNGMNASGFHLAALVLHSLNAALCFVVLRRLLAAGFEQDQARKSNQMISVAAALGALLWSLNPLRVEPVARATDLTYDQSLFFTLVSLWCYLRSVEESRSGGGGKRSYAGAVGAFALAMLSYPFVCGYAGVLLVLDFYPLRRISISPGWWRDGGAKRILLEKAPFFLLAGLIGLTFYGRLHPEGMYAAKAAPAQLSLFGRAMQAFYIWAYYLWKPWAPFHLSPVYTTLLEFNPMTWPFAASATAVIGLSVVFVWKRREWPLGLTLWLCHLGLLLPALGLTEHPHYANDRYDHVAGILWSALVAAAFFKYCRSPGRMAQATAIVAALVVASGILSRQQLRIWRDTPTLFNYMIVELGDDPFAEFVHLCLGNWYAGNENPAEAEHEYETAIRLMPNDPDPHDGLGVVFSNTGRLRESEEQLEWAVRLNPADADTHEHLGSTFLKLGRTGEAMAQFELAIRLAPDDFEANDLLGVLLCNQGRTDEAIQHFKQALGVQPDYAEAHNGLGVALLQEGRLDEAVEQFRAGLAVKPDYAEACHGLGVALFKQGHTDEAIEYFETALRLKPDYADARASLDFALSQKSRSKARP